MFVIHSSYEKKCFVFYVFLTKKCSLGVFLEKKRFFYVFLEKKCSLGVFLTKKCFVLRFSYEKMFIGRFFLRKNVRWAFFLTKKMFCFHGMKLFSVLLGWIFRIETRRRFTRSTTSSCVFIIASYFALTARSELLSYFMIILLQMTSASVLSLPLPL